MSWALPHDESSHAVVLYHMICGSHPYDMSNDIDAVGEEMAEGQRRLNTAQSWREFRSTKGQGALKVGRTEQEQTVSRLYEAATKFAVRTLPCPGLSP